MKPKVIIFSCFPDRSGAEACAEEIINNLKDQYDFTLITARMNKKYPKKDTFNGVPVIRVGFGYTFDKWLYPDLAPLAAAQIKPDLIHGILETFAGLALLKSKFFCPGAKRLLTMQTTNRKFLKRKIVSSPDRVTAISTVLKNVAATFGRRDVVLIPNGVHSNALPEGVEKVPGRMLYVGRLEQMKGIDTLLRAFALLRQAGHDIHLRIVGDGSERDNLGCLVRELNIIDHVTFVGRLPALEVYDEYAAAHIFCGLSRSEALGNVFLEAQLAGCGVVGTNVGGIPDILIDGETGLLVPPDDFATAAQALEKLLTDQELYDRLATAAMEHAKQYDWSEIAKGYNVVYREMLA